MENDFLTASEVATKLGISLATVYKLVRSGALEHYKFEGSYRFERATVEAYIESCKVSKPTDEQPAAE